MVRPPRLANFPLLPFSEPVKQGRKQHGGECAQQHSKVLVKTEFKGPEVVNRYRTGNGNHHQKKSTTHFLTTTPYIGRRTP